MLLLYGNNQFSNRIFWETSVTGCVKDGLMRTSLKKKQRSDSTKGATTISMHTEISSKQRWIWWHTWQCSP